VSRSAASADVFHAIADANRRALLDLVAARESTVGELVDGVGLSYSAVSQHLSVLRDAGLVSSSPRGRERVYRLTPDPLRKVHSWTGRYEQFWRARLARLRSVLDERKR
jgi:DNA-binding transcriptional ArsR family regulator